MPKETAAAKFIMELATKTTNDLAIVCKWELASEKRLSELAGMLKDPLAEAQKLERLATALRDYGDGLKVASSTLADSRISEITGLRRSAQELRAHANASAAAAFATEPLRGVGEGPWRALFEAAEAYSQQHAYPGEPFPVTTGEAHCVLCHQELDTAARDRFTRFAGFVTGAMNAKAAAAEVAREFSALGHETDRPSNPRVVKRGQRLPYSHRSTTNR